VAAVGAALSRLASGLFLTPAGGNSVVGAAMGTSDGSPGAMVEHTIMLIHTVHDYKRVCIHAYFPRIPHFQNANADLLIPPPGVRLRSGVSNGLIGFILIS